MTKKAKTRTIIPTKKSKKTISENVVISDEVVEVTDKAIEGAVTEVKEVSDLVEENVKYTLTKFNKEELKVLNFINNKIKLVGFKNKTKEELNKELLENKFHIVTAYFRSKLHNPAGVYKGYEASIKALLKRLK